MASTALPEQKNSWIKTFLSPLWQSQIIICIRALLFELYETATNFSLERKKFKSTVGYALNLRNPRTLNEKIVWKKLFDRNPLLIPTSDKYLARTYVTEVLGVEQGGVILVPLVAVSDKPDHLPWERLSDGCIIKTNHDSGGNIIVKKGETPNKEEIIKKINSWLKKSYGVFKHEWAYKKIKQRKVIVESLLYGADGDLAQDYKFHVFHGKCRFIHTTPKINGVRIGKRSLFSPDWKQFPVGWKHPQGPYVAPPEKLDEMIRLAEKLAEPFDYVRVDLYNPPGHIYFGELTHYHGSGMEYFIPEAFDFEAGAWWNNVPGYWMKK